MESKEYLRRFCKTKDSKELPKKKGIKVFFFLTKINFLTKKRSPRNIIDLKPMVLYYASFQRRIFQSNN